MSIEAVKMIQPRDCTLATFGKMLAMLLFGAVIGIRHCHLDFSLALSPTVASKIGTLTNSIAPHIDISAEHLRANLFHSVDILDKKSAPPAAMPISSAKLQTLLTNVKGSTGYKYGMKDSRGVGMDCVRVIYAPIQGVKRYLAVYHHLDSEIKKFHIFVAQSFDLLSWEFLRRIVSNADMPAVEVDGATGKVLLVYEHFLSSKDRWPCAIGVRMYESVDTFISGKPLVMYTAPNTISRIEGTPNIYRFDPTLQLIELGFHYQNETLVRDQVARGFLSGFPGKDTSWTTMIETQYNEEMTNQGVTGNIGGRDLLQFNSNGTNNPTSFMISEGNIQPPPSHPTDWKSWRVWLWIDLKVVMPLTVQTHRGSIALANPSMVLVPSPNTGHSALFVSYFIFSEGAATGEGGSLAFFTEL